MRTVLHQYGGKATVKAVSSLYLRVVLIAAFFLIGISNATAQAIDVQRSQEVQSANWKRFVSVDGRFSILFPGEPIVSEQTVDHPLWKFVLHKHQLRTFAEYGVMYANYPKSVTESTSADVLLDEGAKGAVAEVNSQLLSISRISVGGYPGRFLKERMPDGTIMQAKMVLVGQRMYQIAITTPREDEADPETVGFYNSIAQKFVDSFELTHVFQDSVLVVGSCPPDVQNCVPVTEEVLKGRALSLPKPSYPPIARAAHASGTVVVQVLIDEQGNVISAAAISGHPLLQAASVNAARAARFEPTLVDNKPVKVAGVIQYNFIAM
jgi:TonB family protein